MVSGNSCIKSYEELLKCELLKQKDHRFIGNIKLLFSLLKQMFEN